MKILLVNQYAGSPQHGMEYRPFHLGSHWAASGHSVTVVAGSYSHLRLRNPGVGITLRAEYVDGLRYVWLPTPHYSGNGYRRAANILTFSAGLLVRSREFARTCRPDVVISSSTHPLDVYGAHAIATLCGAVHVHEVHDLWPMTLIELGGMSSRHPFVMVLQRAEDFAYARAHLVVSMLPGALPYMELHGLDPDRYAHVPNGVDPAEWAGERRLPEPHAAVLAELGARDKFVVGYAGGFATANDVETLLAAIPMLDQRIHVVLVGDGTLKGALSERFAGPNTTFLPAVPKAYIPALLERFDVCFIGAKRSPLYAYGVNQNKLFDYMMAGRPIVSAMEAYNDPVTESGAGLTVPPEDPCAIAEAIHAIAGESVESRISRGEAGLRYVLEHHDYAELAGKFMSEIDRAREQGKRPCRC
jgi:glycosyltransferase involved in cell wall biosynthesis